MNRRSALLGTSGGLSATKRLHAGLLGMLLAAQAPAQPPQTTQPAGGARKPTE